MLTEGVDAMPVQGTAATPTVRIDVTLTEGEV
jgi:hypothetical protein